MLVIMGTLMMFSTPSDPDFGWHYKYGEHFFSTGQLLKENIFSYTYTDYMWVNSYWLFELILFFTHSYFGHIVPTLILGFAASVFCLAIIRKLAKNEIAVYLSFVLLAGILSSYNITVRPHYYSSLFMLFLLYSLIFVPKLKMYLPLIFLFWVNLHAEFVIGLFVLGTYTFFEAIRMYRQKSPVKDLASLFGIPALCVAVTLINPNGINLHITLFKELTLPVKSYVQEWSHYDIEKFERYITYIFILTVALVGGFYMRKKAGLWYFLLAIFFALFSIKAVYMIRVMFVVTFYGFLLGTDKFFTDLMNFLNDTNKAIIRRFITYTYYGAFLVVLVNSLWKIMLATDTRYWSINHKYPYDAISFVKQNPIKGRMLNAYNWGGYLIWQLPEYQTFIDGRMTSWRETDNYFMSDYYRIHEPKILNKYVTQYGITWVIDYPTSKLAKYLKQQPGEWEEYYKDENSVIYVKKDSNSETI